MKQEKKQIKYNKWILLTIIIYISLFTILPKINGAELNNFKINIDITSPNSAKITENWQITYSSQEDLQKFKNQILQANIDLTKLAKISDKLKPHIYINNFFNLTVGLDEINNYVRLTYETNDLILTKYFENEEEILWKFNENLFKDFTSNNLYHIPIDSYLIISVYSPLVIQDPVPQGIIEKTKLTWTGISSNELRLLALEKKPPKPSFAVSLEQQRITKTYIIIIIILIILTIIVMNKKTNKKIEKFVINHSEIKPAKINDIHKLENEEIEIK